MFTKSHIFMGLLLEILYILRELSLTKALLCLPTNYQAYLALHKSILAMPQILKTIK